VGLDLKNPQGIEAALRLIDQADALIEGFRPGVMERLSLGPDDCLARNPTLVYGRMTGWGQDGPLAKAAGHDINYISLTGVLAAVGKTETGPIPPLNLVGDFGGGGMLLSFGLLAALWEAQRSGKGQVVDAAMTDGSAMLMAAFFGRFNAGAWSLEREDNLLDGAAPFYNTYECADGKWISIGALEPQFYDPLIKALGLTEDELGDRWDKSLWPRQQQIFTALFLQKSRQDWCSLMEPYDVCFTPILDMGEAPDHPHNTARGTYVTHDGVQQPAPAPRFSRTQAELGRNASAPGTDTHQTLSDWGFSKEELEGLCEEGVIHE
jgi:alpha-methylacyl-CoA racemase